EPSRLFRVAERYSRLRQERGRRSSHVGRPSECCTSYSKFEFLRSRFGCFVPLAVGLRTRLAMFLHSQLQPSPRHHQEECQGPTKIRLVRLSVPLLCASRCDSTFHRHLHLLRSRRTATCEAPVGYPCRNFNRFLAANSSAA